MTGTPTAAICGVNEEAERNLEERESGEILRAMTQHESISEIRRRRDGKIKVNC